VHDADLEQYPRLGSATVWLSGGSVDDRVNLDRLLKEELRSSGLNEDDAKFSETPKVVTVNGPEACWDALQSELADVLSIRTRGSIIVLAQCNVSKVFCFFYLRVTRFRACIDGFTTTTNSRICFRRSPVSKMSQWSTWRRISASFLLCSGEGERQTIFFCFVLFNNSS